MGVGWAYCGRGRATLGLTLPPGCGPLLCTPAAETKPDGCCDDGMGLRRGDEKRKCVDAKRGRNERCAVRTASDAPTASAAAAARAASCSGPRSACLSGPPPPAAHLGGSILGGRPILEAGTLTGACTDATLTVEPGAALAATGARTGIAGCAAPGAGLVMGREMEATATVPGCGTPPAAPCAGAWTVDTPAADLVGVGTLGGARGGGQGGAGGRSAPGGAGSSCCVGAAARLGGRAHPASAQHIAVWFALLVPLCGDVAASGITRVRIGVPGQAWAAPPLGGGRVRLLEAAAVRRVPARVRLAACVAHV